MKRVIALILLGLVLGVVACGEKITIPEAVGIPTSTDYLEVGEWILDDPADLVESFGKFYIVETESGTMAKHFGNGVVDQGPVTGLLSPTAICIDELAPSERRIIVAENGDGSVGPRLSFFDRGDLTPAGSFDLTGLVKSISDIVTRNDSLYIADPDSGSVLRFVWIDHDSGVLEARGEVCNAAGSDESPQNPQLPVGLAFDAEGYLLVVNADTLRNWVHRFDPAPLLANQHGEFVEFRAGSCVPLDYQAAVLGKAPPCGEPLLEFQGPGTGSGEFHAPRGVAVDGEGNIYVTDSGNQRTERFLRDGIYELQFGSSLGGARPLGLPTQIVVRDWAGDCGLLGQQDIKGAFVYVIDRESRTIRQFESSRAIGCGAN